MNAVADTPTATLAHRRPSPLLWLKTGAPYWVSSLVIVGVWWIASVSGALDPNVLPGPQAVIRAGIDLNDEGLLWPSLGISVFRIVLGTAIGAAAGIILGLGSGATAATEIVFDRPIQMLRAIPFNALSPLLIIMLGIGETMKVALIAIGVFVPLYLNSFAGVRGIDPKLLELATVYEVKRPTVVFHVLFRGSLPSILTGLRFSLAIAWIALVTSETVNSQSGVGYLLNQAQQFVRTDRVVLCIVIYAVLGLLTDWAVRSLETRLLRWRRP
ncbi:MAG: ABC transporter permease [Gordonia sp. (in: high G+C Gram-positive bacteria)]